MNTPTTPATPDTAQEAAHLKKLRDQISTDIEAMQQKEASLKEYEQRLRLLMEHNQQGQPAPQSNQHFVTAGPNSQQALDAEWEKYDRAHALLEAARRGLTDDRLALKEREEKLTLRESDVARREGWIRARELEVAAVVAAKAAKAATPIVPEPTFVSDPIRAARNMLLSRKGKA